MDGNRFDELTRVLGSGRSRRSVFKALGAAALGAVGLDRLGGTASAGGGNSACAQWCHANFSGSDAGHCTSDAAHGTGACYQCGPAAPAGSTMQLCGGVCIKACTALDPCHVPGTCNPATQSCTNPNAVDGTNCDDGNLCNGVSTCKNGVCTAGTPVTCAPPAACFDAGVCDPNTGTCTYSPSAKGTACSDGKSCTVGDACNGKGACISGPIACPECKTCDAQGNCGPDASQNGGACKGNGDPCFKHACLNGTCVDTPVVCLSPTGDPCHVGVCKADGTCGFADASDTTPCSVPNGTGACKSGVCTVSTCNPGFADCDGKPGDGCETNTSNDPANCGACNHVCNTPNATPACTNGTCGVASCNPGFANCNNNALDGCEVNTAADPNNCGACGKACPTPKGGSATCTAGACGAACPAATPTYCNVSNACVNTATDAHNCGSCNSVCLQPGNGSATCNSGTCVTTCNRGYQSDGHGGCTPVNCAVSPAGTACGTDGVCTAGQCFQSYPNCPGCYATSSEGQNLCEPSCNFSCGAPCTSSAQCPSGDFCAYLPSCGAGYHCDHGVSA